jgi:L-threonylcarbamoyladenylate synthase
VTAAVRAAKPGPFADAVAHLRAGGLVAYPTETVWGLGADARSEPALARLLAFKGRDAAQPIALLVTGLDAARRLGIRVDEPARRLAQAFWPGPLTLVLPGKGGFARGVERSDGAIGLRCSPHPTTRALAEAVERAGVGPLTATSLNRSGEQPATSADAARKLCAGTVEAVLVLDAAQAPPGSPSTVVDLTGSEPVLLRRGGIDEGALRAALETHA